MNDDLEKQIRMKMSDKETEELVEIWKKNDHAEWTDQALEVVREILLERLGEVPEQDVIEEEDTYHNPKRIIRIAGWAWMLSWFVLGWTVILVFIVALNTFQMLNQLVGFTSFIGILMVAFVTLAGVLIGLFCLYYYRLFRKDCWLVWTLKPTRGQKSEVENES